MPTPLHLTPDGFQRLQRTLGHEYARLEEARRVVQEQMEAGGQENQGLEAAQREVMATLDRIAELEDTLARVVVTQRPGGEDDRAALGAVVTLLDQDTGRELRLQLVSPAEASATVGELPRVSTETVETAPKGTWSRSFCSALISMPALDLSGRLPYSCNCP